MAVRVKVEIALGSRSVEVVAIANTGYESSDAQVLLPGTVAKCLQATRAPKATPLRYATAGGMDLALTPLGTGSARVRVPDRETAPTAANLLFSPNETEVAMNDVLVEALGLVLVKPAHGIWRFRDDPHDRERPSEPRATY